MLEHADPQTIEAIAAARQAHAQATGKWVSDDEDELAAEAEQLARDAIDHLDGARWDEAQACAEEVAGLAEAEGQGEVWREIVVLVDEAAEVGRGAPERDGEVD